jgi:hypothetical protein
MKKLSGSILFLLSTIFLAPALTLLAQGSFGGILVKDEVSGMEFTDSFNTQKERDSFGAFFNTTLPNDVSLEWGSEALEDGSILRTDADTSNDLVLTWSTLPEPLGGCGGFTSCAHGLTVEVYKRTDDVFEAVWYGEYSASGVWGGMQPHTGMRYVGMDSQTFSFSEEGEYYMYVHRPNGVFVNRKEHIDKRYVDTFRDIILPVAYAYDASKYSASVVGGVLVTVTHQTEGETTLTLPEEGRYEGERGVVAPGPHPERGYPDEEVFTFKVVYTNSENTAPESVEVDIGGTRTGMVIDTTAEDALLRDGDYTNGEQYVATTTLSKGGTWYAFHAIVNDETITLAENPADESLTCMAGYSSVAFVPGLQASRLFKKGAVFENKLWEPNIDADAQYLNLNEDATPVNTDIYTKIGIDGVVDEALGITTNIYKSFLNDLDEWKNDEHIIADYVALPYDWRFAYETILGSGIEGEGDTLWYGPEHATETPYMYKKLRELAETSDSGRIFLVGHSMGGLIIKKMLADMEDDASHPYRDVLSKIDNVALVASPQLGTPKAVASLLHGAEQELDIPIVHYPNFVTDETARMLGNGLPSSYTLLPSRTYFERVKDVNLEGEEGSYTELIINGNCPTATDYNGMLACFDTSSAVVEKDDLVTPLKPRDEYVEYADELHDKLDNWTPPDLNDDGQPDYTVTQIAGWGIGTIASIEYKEKERKVTCPPDLTGVCTETFMDPQPRYTIDGDRTVVVPSAVGMGVDDSVGVETLYVDMFEHNEKVIVNRKHSNILEIDSLRKALKNITKNKDVLFESPDYIYRDYDELEYTEPFMRLALHSPVAIEVESGNYKIGKRTLSDGGIAYEAEIPNSYYDTLGEGKYVGFPLNGEEHTIHLIGTALGTFTFEMSIVHDGVVTETKTFEDVPVTESTQATLVLSNFEDVTTLSLDIDGDGEVDTVVQPKETGTVVTYNVLIDALEELTVPYKRGLIGRAKLAKRLDEQGRERIAKILLRSLERSIKRLSSHRLPSKWRIPDEDLEKLLEIINELKKKYES